jgi:hypothetical protein
MCFFFLPLFPISENDGTKKKARPRYHSGSNEKLNSARVTDLCGFVCITRATTLSSIFPFDSMERDQVVLVLTTPPLQLAKEQKRNRDELEAEKLRERDFLKR